jgi:hypothetical protein
MHLAFGICHGRLMLALFATGVRVASIIPSLGWTAVFNDRRQRREPDDKLIELAVKLQTDLIVSRPSSPGTRCDRPYQLRPMV